MSDIALADEVVSDTPFFAPAPTDLVEELLGQYGVARKRIDQVAALVTGDLGNVLHYFIEGNSSDDRRYNAPSVSGLFDATGAIAALNSAMWSKALSLTDVYDYMPQARRDEWNTMMREQKAPEFTAEAVRPTLMELLNSRERFFAERVDGIFRGLSGMHVTNAPEAFGKRMIIAHVVSAPPFSSVDCSRAGLINDLRCVIAKFAGRPEPRNGGSYEIIQNARCDHGEWKTIDGGALRIRVYKVGTAHLEVHPDMAWRLNATLAHMHPMAIPAEFRQKPRRKAKDWAPMVRPLPPAVLEVLAQVRTATEKIPDDWRDRRRPIANTLAMFGGSIANGAVLAEARRVMEAIGGTPTSHGYHWQFDMSEDAALSIVQGIVTSGVMPDKVSHQFYPTPDSLARRVADLLDTTPFCSVLEPSAGQGALVSVAAPLCQRVTAVEVSPLHCDILRARFGADIDVVQGDFIAQAATWWKEGRRFDAVVMNPPFADGRAATHLDHAGSLVAAGGQLVAVLPSGMRGGAPLGAEFEHSWRGPFDNEFAGTSVSVCILDAKRKTT